MLQWLAYELLVVLRCFSLSQDVQRSCQIICHCALEDDCMSSIWPVYVQGNVTHMPTTLYVSRAFHQLLLHCPKPQLYFSSSLDDYHHMPSTGLFHTVLLKSDGTAVAFGDNGAGQCNIPALPEGTTYLYTSCGRIRAHGFAEERWHGRRLW